MNIKYFTYYYDITIDTTFIDRNIYELCKKYDIETNSIPRIINNKNCYSIKEDKLKEFIEKSKYASNRVLILTNNKELKGKTKLLTICKYNEEIFVPQETTEIYTSISNNKIIKVDGNLYIKITKEDLENIKNEYLKKDINIEKEIIEITPIKK